MERAQTLTILNALANGVNPATGKQFPVDSPYQHPDTVRALYAAVHAVEAARADRPSREGKPAAPPANIGSRWTPEGERLALAFDEGKRIAELASLHGRSIAAIEARLLKLGKIDAAAVTSTLRYGNKARAAGPRANT